MDQPVPLNKSLPQALSSQPLQAWLPQILVLGYLVVALIALLVIPVAASRWLRIPNLGLLVGPGLYFLEVPADSAAYAQGLRSFDQLLELDGIALDNAAELNAQLAKHAPGDVVSIQAVRAGGQPFTAKMILSSLSNASRLSNLYIPFTAGVIYLASAVWSFAVWRSRASGRILAFFYASLGLVLAGLFDLFSSQQLVWLWLVAFGLASGAMFNLAFIFPREEPFIQRTSSIRIAGLVPGVLLAVYAGLISWDPNQFRLALALLTGTFCLAFLFAVGYVLSRYMKIVTSNEREQQRTIFLAGLFSFAPFVIWAPLHVVLGAGNYPPAWALLPMIIFPLATAYTLRRFRLHRADFILGQTMLYGLMVVLVAVGYALLTVGLSLILGRLFSLDNPIFSGVIFFILALCILPLRERMQKMIDTVFFRGEEAYQDRLSSFSGELTRVVDLNAILGILRRYIDEVLAPNRMHIFVFDPLIDQYVATAGKNGRSTSDLHFTSASPLVQLLMAHGGPILLADQTTLPVAFQAEKARLDLLGASVFVALPGQERLAGWVGLGKRNSGEFFTAREMNLLEALCDQAAIAIERAQVLANMENRVRQMDVLARVAQGVNITLNMDDILELIYAQTTQVIRTDEFHIMLYDVPHETFQYVFYLEGDERLTDLENKPVTAGESLEQEVIRQHKSIFTEDYNRECQRRRIVTSPDREGVFAWLAVPLNAGAETIGVLSLGSRDPRMEYTAEQLNLAQSIADQVAGAIVKARLLQETERRALQLTTLNDMTRQLTSTLDLEPLLQNILQSAVDILVCDAGSLLMVDEVTEELVFRVVVGPVAVNLVNRRMAPGSGVVGKAVKNRQPIIVNDVTRFPEWFSKTDQQTGFITRALLVIPLQVKDKVIGVIEVINKKDGTPFTQDDQDLLSAFAAQAAVAIENARLYTLTDQALGARVEELSVMQRIDRELNTSLDTTLAMRITLEWAMRQSGAQAGLVGVLQENGLKVMAWQGYAHELDGFTEETLPVEQFGLDIAISEAIPLRRQLTNSEDNRRILNGAHTQVVIPIRREANTIGVLFLESILEEATSEEIMNFLVRLSDHASIAIFNAQLYTAVQNANLAKSEFVSFVAHELKNPMTSVKGYTELLAAGAVGAVSDAQANFLNTIRSNIERMNTLVSDLNDVSKIEVGRLRLDFKAIALPEIIEGVVRSTKRQIEEKQQTLMFEIAPELPLAWADRTRVEQVLVNLVSNAHKYTLAGGTINVGASRDVNTWDSSGAPEVIHIWVRDSGIGITEEDQKKIFQKFFRSDDPKTREVPGTGLGLNITRSLVEMQGGKIWFESEFRKGTTFHFTVPISAQ